MRKPDYILCPYCNHRTAVVDAQTINWGCSYVIAMTCTREACGRKRGWVVEQDIGALKLADGEAVNEMLEEARKDDA